MKASQDLEPELVEMRKSTATLERASNGLSGAVRQFRKSPARVEAVSRLFAHAAIHLSNSRRRIGRSRKSQCSRADLKKQMASWWKTLWDVLQS